MTRRATALAALALGLVFATLALWQLATVESGKPVASSQPVSPARAPVAPKPGPPPQVRHGRVGQEPPPMPALTETPTGAGPPLVTLNPEHATTLVDEGAEAFESAFSDWSDNTLSADERARVEDITSGFYEQVRLRLVAATTQTFEPTTLRRDLKRYQSEANAALVDQLGLDRARNMSETTHFGRQPLLHPRAYELIER